MEGLFFRGQHLDHAQHVAMARQFGEPTIGHAVFDHVEGYPEIYSVAKNRTANENREAMMVTPWSGWHTDITAAVNPPCASILRGVTIPLYRGAADSVRGRGAADDGGRVIASSTEG
jgi:taurine dioxygenase